MTPSTIWRHLTKGPWGFARSAPIGFWESSAYTFLGSFVWEVAGETTKPSINDQVASGIGGSFLGEPLFRLASLVLEDGGDNPGFWRELGAAVLSPPTGFNRLAFGDRFKGVFPSHNPATFTRLRLGTSLTEYGAGGLGFRIERADGIGSACLFSEIGGTGAHVAAFHDESVKPRTNYSYRVHAWNATGNSSPSNVAEVRTPQAETELPSDQK